MKAAGQSPEEVALLSCALEPGAEHCEWDEFLARTRGGDLVQSSAWGRFKQTSSMEIHRIVVRSDRTIVGGAQLIVRQLRVLGATAYIPYGPIVAAAAPAETSALLATSIRSYCREIGIRALWVQPPDGGVCISAALRAVGFGPTQTSVAPSASIRVDLQRDPGEILDTMSTHTRKDIRRSWREPIAVRFGTCEDLESFYELYCCTAERQAFTPLPAAYFEALWDQLHPAGHLQMLIADVDGIDVAGNIVTCFGSSVTGRFLGFDPRRLPRRMRPTEALVWACIIWARSRGFSTLDVGGIKATDAIRLRPSDNPNVSDNGAVVHKIGFGGEPIIYPEPLELIPNSVLRAGLRALTTNQALQRIRHKTEHRARAGRHTKPSSSDC